MKPHHLFLATISISALLISSCQKNVEEKKIEKKVKESVSKEIWVNMLVEIPAGEVKKFELNKTSGLIEMDSLDGKPRLIQYLGYPANYGMIPNTLLSFEQGGDGDPLDILSIGPADSSGSQIRSRVIGVLKLLDRGEQDDKLIAISENSTLSNVNSLAELKHQYPGILEIIEIWFQNYKGPGKMKSLGYGKQSEAIEILKKAQL